MQREREDGRGCSRKSLFPSGYGCEPQMSHTGRKNEKRDFGGKPKSLLKCPPPPLAGMGSHSGGYEGHPSLGMACHP